MARAPYEENTWRWAQRNSCIPFGIMAKKALDKCQVPANFLDIYSIQVINYTSSTGPNDTIQNDPNQLAEHQLQYFLVSKQLFHTLSRHNNHNRSAFDCEPTRSYVNVICTHLSHLGHGRSHCKYCHFQNPSNASACPTKNPLLLSFVGSVQLRPSATASGGCSWSCRTCGWPATKGGTPWVHEKVKRNDMTKGTRNCQTMKTCFLRLIICVLLTSHLVSHLTLGEISPAPAAIQSRCKTLCKIRQTIYQLGQPYDLPIEAEAERKI